MSSEGVCPRCGSPLGISGTCHVCAIQEDIKVKQDLTRAIRCHGCKKPLALIDAHTWAGFYYCEACLYDIQKDMPREQLVAALAKMEKR